MILYKFLEKRRLAKIRVPDGIPSGARIFPSLRFSKNLHRLLYIIKCLIVGHVLYDILKICLIGFRHFLISLRTNLLASTEVIFLRKKTGCWRCSPPHLWWKINKCLLEAKDARKIYKTSAEKFRMCLINSLIHVFSFFTFGQIQIADVRA